MLVFLKVAYKTKVFKNFAKKKQKLGALLEQSRSTKLLEILSIYYFHTYLLYNFRYNVYCHHSSRRYKLKSRGTWLPLENCKISKSEHLMSLKFRKTFVVKLCGFLCLIENLFSFLLFVFGTRFIKLRQWFSLYGQS